MSSYKNKAIAIAIHIKSQNVQQGPKKLKLHFHKKSFDLAWIIYLNFKKSDNPLVHWIQIYSERKKEEETYKLQGKKTSGS